MVVANLHKKLSKKFVCPCIFIFMSLRHLYRGTMFMFMRNTK